jgi:hypothetical protein
LALDFALLAFANLPFAVDTYPLGKRATVED